MCEYCTMIMRKLNIFLPFQGITENKLKAFNTGSMNVKKGLSKKEQEEMRKKVSK